VDLQSRGAGGQRRSIIVLHAGEHGERLLRIRRSSFAVRLGF